MAHVVSLILLELRGTRRLRGYWRNLITVPFILPLLFIEFPQDIRVLDWGIILIIGTISIFAFILAFKGFHKVEAHRGGIILFLDLFTPVLLVMIFFSEFPDLRTIIGGVLIILGLVLSKE